MFCPLEVSSCDGRVVKALDLKSNGIFPRRFEPCSQRIFFIPFPYHRLMTSFLKDAPQILVTAAAITEQHTPRIKATCASKIIGCFRPGSNRGPFAC